MKRILLTLMVTIAGSLSANVVIAGPSVGVVIGVPPIVIGGPVYRPAPVYYAPAPVHYVPAPVYYPLCRYTVLGPSCCGQHPDTMPRSLWHLTITGEMAITAAIVVTATGITTTDITVGDT